MLAIVRILLFRQHQRFELLRQLPIEINIDLFQAFIRSLYLHLFLLIQLDFLLEHFSICLLFPELILQLFKLLVQHFDGPLALLVIYVCCFGIGMLIRLCSQLFDFDNLLFKLAVFGFQQLREVLLFMLELGLVAIVCFLQSFDGSLQ